MYFTGPADWVTRFVGGVSPLCRDIVGVFYSPSRLGHRALVGEGLTPLQRYSHCILQPQPTGPFTHLNGLTVLIDTLMGPNQVLPLQVRVYLGVIVMKEYSIFPKTPALLEPQHQNILCHIQDSCSKVVLHLCRDAVVVFSCPCRVGNIPRMVVLVRVSEW